jgi:chemotaxis receptor (MCP) glutamine deamidase CheD
VTFDGGPARGELGTSELLWTYSPLEPAKRVYLAPGQLFASGDHVQVFADHATRLLLQRVLALGAERGHLRAKLFGGACALGACNVEVARERLAAERIPVVAEDTGGDLGRKLIFEGQTGSAWVRAIDANCRQ